MKFRTFLLFLAGFILLLTGPVLYCKFPNTFEYFVTYKEYFKTMVPAIFTCAAIMSTWLLSKYQNEREIRKKQKETLENNRPQFIFENYLNTNLIATVKDGNSFLKNFFLVGIDTDKKFFNLQMKPYIFIKDIYVSNILYKDFIIYYITSENECFICLYQDDTFTYYNLASASISGNQVLVRFLDRVNKFPIIDDKEYNNNDVLLEDMKSIVDKVKINEINEACISLLYFIRLYRTELSQDFVIEKLGIIKYILMFNQYGCGSYSNIEYLKGNLYPSKTKNFNQIQMKRLENTDKIGIEFILKYLDHIISEINSHNLQKLDDFILRNIEIYIQDSTDIFTINYETKKELVHFEFINVAETV